MDILSTGQKIKRARIYKGITLKELCGDKISISKMSCIENDKIKADEETIKYISQIIEIDHVYLMQDVYDQLLNNLTNIKDKPYEIDEFEVISNKNLSYALEYQYFDLAFELIHVMFSYYIKMEQYEKAEVVIPKYYHVYEKTISKENTITYFVDMGLYYYKKEKFNDAATHFSRIIELGMVNDDNEKLYSSVIFYEASCYYKLKNYGKSYELLKRIIEIPSLAKCGIMYGKVLNIYNAICIRFRYNEPEKYLIECDQSLKENPGERAKAKREYGEAYFSIGNSEKAIKEITDAINIFPTENKKQYVEFVIKCIEIYYNYSEFDKAYQIAEENLNLSIESQNIRLIEKSYYLKSEILEKLDRLMEAEIYMNLSLDSLMKFGTKKERVSRYIDLANLYYKLENMPDSIKYFNFAINLEKIV